MDPADNDAMATVARLRSLCSVEIHLMTPTEWKAQLAKIPAEWHGNLEERAAIHEFDGGLSRDAAEDRALLEYWLVNRSYQQISFA